MIDFKSPLDKRLDDLDNQLASLTTAFQIVDDRLPFMDYYSQIEAAFYLGMSESDLAEIVGKKLIKSSKPFDGRHWFKRDDMNAFLRDSKNGKAAFIESKQKKKNKKEMK